jgi:hypothetical protein
MRKEYNIAKPEKYGEKTYWYNVGKMVDFTKDNKTTTIIEIPAISLKAYVFEKKDKNPQSDNELPY